MIGIFVVIAPMVTDPGIASDHRGGSGPNGTRPNLECHRACLLWNPDACHYSPGEPLCRPSRQRIGAAFALDSHRSGLVAYSIDTSIDRSPMS